IIGDDSSPANSDLVHGLDDHQIAGNAAVTVSSSGLLDLSSTHESIGALSGLGHVMIGDLDVGADNSSSVFAGTISGFFGSFSKFGLGTFTLAGNNSYGGDTLVKGGVLLVNGFQPQNPIFVSSFAILGGTGTVGSIENINGGVVSPGASPGILTCSNVNF